MAFRHRARVPQRIAVPRARLQEGPDRREQRSARWYTDSVVRTGTPLRPDARSIVHDPSGRFLGIRRGSRGAAGDVRARGAGLGPANGTSRQRSQSLATDTRVFRSIEVWAVNYS